MIENLRNIDIFPRRVDENLFSLQSLGKIRYLKRKCPVYIDVLTHSYAKIARFGKIESR
jgi:hypothetical protein